MRFFLLLIVILLLVWKLWPDQPVPTADESFIGPQIQGLRKAEKLEEDYLDALDQKRKQMEEQADGQR